jgi:hypothetical protein
MTHTSYPANSAQLAQSWEISVSEEMRGGAERTLEGRVVYARGHVKWQAATATPGRFNVAEKLFKRLLSREPRRNRSLRTAVSVSGKRMSLQWSPWSSEPFRRLLSLPAKFRFPATERLWFEETRFDRVIIALQEVPHASNPANSALLAQSWEISVSERTPCQARSSIEPVSVTAPMLQARAHRAGAKVAPYAANPNQHRSASEPPARLDTI